MTVALEEIPPSNCQRHPEATAGWKCDNCQAPVCPDCVVVRRAIATEYFACGLCNGRVVPILVHRPRIPVPTQLRQALRYPFSASGMQVLIGLSAFLALTRALAESTFLLLKFLPALFGLGVFWGTFFSIVRSTADGKRELDTPDYTDFFADCVAPAVRGFVGTSLLWLPGLLYVLFLKEWDFSKPVNDLLETPAFYVTGGLPAIDVKQVLLDPILWIIVLVGAVWVPIVFLLAAAGQSSVRMLNPVMVVRVARRLGRDYLDTLAALAVLTVVMGLMRLVAAGILWVGLPLLSRLAAEFVTCLAPFMMAYVLGLLMYSRGDVLGYGTALEYLEPVLGNTRPRTEPPPLVEGPVTAVPEPVAEPTSIALGEKLAALAQAIEARDIEKALALYPEIQEPRHLKQVDPAHHLFVGQAAAAQGRYELSVKALETAADVAPDGPSASRALVLLARVYAERLQEPERAASIYRYVVHRYPDTEASRFAQAHLSPTS